MGKQIRMNNRLSTQDSEAWSESRLRLVDFYQPLGTLTKDEGDCRQGERAFLFTADTLVFLGSNLAPHATLFMCYEAQD